MRLFQGKRRDAKYSPLVDHHGPVFTALYHQRARSHLKNMFGRAQQIVFAGELARLKIVDHQDIHMFQRFAQFRIGPLDPVVHGVQRHNFWSAS